MATIHVDGTEYEVDGNDNLLHACLSLGLDIPYFCYHPALGSVGACRQCGIVRYKDADDKRGRIVMACMTPATDGTYISIEDKEAKEFRRSVDEYLMVNHPHDCPVCPEGGHCHLQDVTVMTGQHKRRYRFTKRTHLNQDLGPFLLHEMNRCIACYRCVRFYNDYADGTDFGVFGAHDNVYFGRITDGTLENEFAGNLSEVCPTGVFTDKTHSDHYVRKWDLQYAPSVCMHCSLGCNISPGERYGEIRRVENRYHGEINHYFLCDRGRYGYGYQNRRDRPRVAFITRDGEQKQAAVDDAMAHVGGLLRAAKHAIGIGSPRASLESNYALRELVGADNFYDGHSDGDHPLVERVLQILREGPVASATLRGLESADAALVLGEDVTQTAPRIALSLRQTAKGKAVKLAAERGVHEWDAGPVINVGQGRKNPIFLTASHATRLDDAAKDCYRGVVEDQARLGFAVAHLIDPQAPQVTGLDEATQTLARRIADDLMAAEKPVIVSGTGARSTAVLDAAANVAWALHARGRKVEIFLTLPEANSFGLGMMHARPLGEALRALSGGEADVAIVVENDLYRRAARPDVDSALEHARVIAVDHEPTDTVQHAEVVLPAATSFEGDGTVVNNEGRAQRFFQVFDTAYYHQDIVTTESWRWLRRAKSHATANGRDASTLDELTTACAETFPELSLITAAAPGAQFRIDGLKAAREPHRYSGRTAMRAKFSVHEPHPPRDADSALAYSMEGYNGTGADEASRPAALIPYAWAPGWNSPQAVNKLQEYVGGPLRGGDPGKRLVEPTANAGPRYFDGIPAAFTPSGDTLRVVSLPQIYGSEMLSARAPAVASRIPPAYVALPTQVAAAQALKEGDLAVVHVGEAALHLPVRVSKAMPAGVIGLPEGSAGIPWLAAGTTATLSRETAGS